MKEFTLFIISTIFYLNSYAQVGIKDNGLAPIPSAQLEVQSTTRAFYPSRMTTIQKNSIATPEAGAVVYDTDLKCLSLFDGIQWSCTDKKMPPNCCLGNYAIGKISNASTQITVSNIKADINGNFYIVGYYKGGDVDIYNLDGSSAITLSNSGGVNSFLLKYNSQGNLLWSSRISGGTVHNGTPLFSLSVDAGGVVVSGYIANYTPNTGLTTIYNARNSIASPETSWGTLSGTTTSDDGVVVRYNTAGTVQWVARIAGSILTQKVASDGTSIVVSYQHYRYPSIGSTSIYHGRTNSSNTEIQWGTFSYPTVDARTIVKYNINTGAVEWVSKIANNTGGDIAVSGSNLFFSCHGSSVSFINGLTTPTSTPIFWGNINSLGNTDTYLVKMSTTTGNINWIARQGGGNVDNAHAMTLDNAGNVYICGTGITSTTTPITFFQARNNLASPEVSWGSPISDGDNLVLNYIVKYNTTGGVVWSSCTTGSSSNVISIYNYSMAVDDMQNVYLSGIYNGTLLNVYHGKSLGTDTQTIFTTVPAISGISDSRSFIAKYNSLGKGECFDKTPNGQNLIRGLAIDNSGVTPTLLGCGDAYGIFQLGSKSILYPTGPQRNGFYFKFTSMN